LKFNFTHMAELVTYDEVFLHKSWEWLNDPEIKKLTLTPNFTKTDQINFFKSLPQRTNYWIKGVLENKEPVAVVGLKNISDTTAEYWGYIGEKSYWGKGLGSFMIAACIAKANTLSLQKIYLKVSKDNERAKWLYLKKGFQLVEEGEIEQYELHL
jgi:RimJ/RimL family protein N-acetyltransferase